MNVLIVEDEPLTLNRIVDLTRRYPGCSLATPCLNPAEALAALEVARFDVALLDIQLPDLSGLDLAALLRSRSPGISVIFITAYNHFAAETFDLEARDYLLKPVREERLHKALDKVVRQRDFGQPLSASKTAAVSIQAFDHFAVSVAGQPLIWHRRKAAELFAFLLCQPERTATKYQLCDALWPDLDGEKALSYLLTIVYQLRQNLQSVHRDLVTIRYFEQKYQLVLTGYQYDVETFEKVTASRANMQSTPYPQLKTIAADYGDGFLAHEDWPWVVTRHNFLTARYLRLLEFLMEQARELGESADQVLYADLLWRLQA